MKTKIIVLTTALLVSMLVAAHDPKEHAKESKAPDCQSLASMDHAKMDMDDPVMKAMFAKCKDATSEYGDGHDKENHDMDMKDTASIKDGDHDDGHNDDHGHDDPH